MTEASDAQVMRVLGLAAKFALMRGRSVVETMAALLSTKTLARLGYDGSGHLTAAQADAAEVIVNNWIWRANEQHKQGRAHGQPDA